MGWKEFPLWLKCGVLIFPICIILFLISGTIVSQTHGGACCSGILSTGSGSCLSTSEACYTNENSNPLILWLAFPISIFAIFGQSEIGQIISNNPLFPFWLVALILILGIYFLTGAIIGLIIQKTKFLEKYNSFRKKK